MIVPPWFFFLKSTKAKAILSCNYYNDTMAPFIPLSFLGSYRTTTNDQTKSVEIPCKRPLAVYHCGHCHIIPSPCFAARGPHKHDHSIPYTGIRQPMRCVNCRILEYTLRIEDFIRILRDRRKAATAEGCWENLDDARLESGIDLWERTLVDAKEERNGIVAQGQEMEILLTREQLAEVFWEKWVSDYRREL